MTANGSMKMRVKMKIKCEQLIDQIQITAWDISEGKEKRLQTPYELCSINEFNNPSNSSIQYWKSHGIDRKSLILPQG